MTTARRTGIITGITVSMVVLGAGSALAYWKTTGSGSGSATAASVWTENTGVAVTSVTPNTRGQSPAQTTVTINGSGFTTGTWTASFGAGITMGTVTRTSATTITAQVTVTPTAVTGVRSITVTQGSTYTCTNCFTVNAPPTLNAGSPAAQVIGHGAANAATYNITGTGFAVGFAATTSDGTFVVTSITRTSSTSISVTVRNDYGDNGNHNADLTITNPDGGSVTATGVLKNK
jgi:hypothetical protein